MARPHRIRIIVGSLAAMLPLISPTVSHAATVGLSPTVAHIYFTKLDYAAAAYPTRIAHTDTIAGFPSLFNDGQGRVWLSYSRAVDSPSVGSRTYTMYSTDRGVSFLAYPRAVPVQNAIRRADGTLLAIAERTHLQADPAVMTVDLWAGPDWTPGTGELVLRTPAQPNSAVLFNQGIIRTGGGLLAPYYARISGDPAGTYRTELAASTDGIHWATRGTIARPFRLASGDLVSYTESSVLQLGSGALMAVLRSAQVRPTGTTVASRQLTYALSIDGGRTWTAPRDVLLNGGRVAEGARPMVLRLPNGGYLLGAGRPDNFVLFAGHVLRDGSPAWTGSLLAYRNYPASPAGYRTAGSSGYVGLAPIGNATVLAAFDNCAPGWGCKSGLSNYTVDGSARIVVRNVVLVPR